MARYNNRFRWDADGQYVLRDSIRPQNTTELHANRWRRGESSTLHFPRRQCRSLWVVLRLLFARQHFAAMLNAAKYLQRGIDLTSNNIFHSRDELRYS